jgi:8-oxo-dGTP pyrophosphatase MutT (NUDIX family)
VKKRKRTERGELPRQPSKRKIRPALRVQYAALPYRFTLPAGLEVLLVTTRRSKRWIIPKGWPIKGLAPSKSAAREAFEEAGVRGKIGTKPVGVFSYDKLLDEHAMPVNCEVKVFPLLVKRQSEVWPEMEQRLFQWFEPSEAVSLISEPQLKKLVAKFANRIATTARKSTEIVIVRSEATRRSRGS